MDAGLVSQWKAVYGELILWDFYVMNAKLKWDARVAAAIRHRQAVRDAADRAQNIGRRRR